jgi:predicted dehydrogenase
MAKRKPVRVGIIGCGDVSRGHLKSYADCGIELVALCDTDLKRAEGRREQFGAPDMLLFDNHKDLLKVPEIDFVTVATPVAFHAPITIDALRAGKHVACEKPSTLSVRENAAIIRAAKKAQKKVIFFSSRMRWGAATLARQYIDDGELGEIYRVDVQYYRRRGRPGLDVIPDAPWFLNAKLAGGGIVMDMGQYFMDMVLDLVGWPKITGVSAATFRGFPHDLPKGVKFDVEEHCTFFARTRSSLTFTFDLAWIANHAPKRCITILGTKGGIRMGDGEPFTYYCEKGGPWRSMNTTSDWGDNQSGNDHIYEEFAQAVRGSDTGLGTTPEQALAITELTQMILLSAARKSEVKPADLKKRK